MNRKLPPLSALRAFEAAAGRESFKLAAAELGVTPTAISHQIRQLEAELGVTLFARSVRKVKLTAEGRALYPALRQAFDLMADAVGTARRGPGPQIATLSATVAFTARLLVPRAMDFRKLNPGWDLRLHASDAVVDLKAGEADAAIRYGQAPYPGLAHVPLLADRFAPVASPRLALKRRADLRQATLIHFEWQAQPKSTIPTWRAWAKVAGCSWLDTEAGIIFNDENSAIQAAVAGQGVALASTALIADELAAGILTQPFGPSLQGFHFDLVYPENAASRPAVAVLRNWVVQALQDPASGVERSGARGGPVPLAARGTSAAPAGCRHRTS